MPYEEHPTFEAPDTAARIWRYMSFTKLLAFLESGCLHFTRADKLVEIDPYEGRLTHVNAATKNLTWDMAPPAFWEAKGFKTEESLKQFVAMKNMRLSWEEADGMLQGLFVNCWHLGNEESDAMWKIYAGDQEGVCIQSTFGHLVSSLNSVEEPIFIGKVKYRNYRMDSINEGDVFAPLMSKRLSFQHEHELRAVVWRIQDTERVLIKADGSPGDANNWARAKSVNKYPDRLGYNIQVNVPSLVETICISPTSRPWFSRLVQSMVEKLGFNLEVRQSDVGEPPPY